MFRKILTKSALCCFILIDEARKDHQRTHQARCRPPFHYRDPPRLLAPPPHPSPFRLRRLRQRPRPPRLGLDRQLRNVRKRIPAAAPNRSVSPPNKRSSSNNGC